MPAGERGIFKVPHQTVKVRRNGKNVINSELYQQPADNSDLDIEPEVNNIAFLDSIIFTLET